MKPSFLFCCSEPPALLVAVRLRVFLRDLQRSTESSSDLSSLHLAGPDKLCPQPLDLLPDSDVSRSAQTGLRADGELLNEHVSLSNPSRYREVMFQGFGTFCQKCSGMISRPRNTVFHQNTAETHPSLTNAAVIQSTENRC